MQPKFSTTTVIASSDYNESFSFSSLLPNIFNNPDEAVNDGNVYLFYYCFVIVEKKLLFKNQKVSMFSNQKSFS